jgi:hypothetical protein
VTITFAALWGYICVWLAISAFEIAFQITRGRKFEPKYIASAFAPVAFIGTIHILTLLFAWMGRP